MVRPVKAGFSVHDLAHIAYIQCGKSLYLSPIGSDVFGGIIDYKSLCKVSFFAFVGHGIPLWLMCAVNAKSHIF